MIPIFKKIIFLTLFLLFFIKCSKQEGCTDNNSINYSLDNKIDNGSCKYITGTWYGGLDIDGSSKTIEFNIDNSNQTSQSGTVKTSHHGQGTFNMVRGINGTSVADSLKNWNHIIINGLLDNNLNGNYNFQLRPNINYTVNNRVNLIIYYDRVVNKPIVSNSFPRYSSSFGARLRLSLNQ